MARQGNSLASEASRLSDSHLKPSVQSTDGKPAPVTLYTRLGKLESSGSCDLAEEDCLARSNSAHVRSSSQVA